MGSAAKSEPMPQLVPWPFATKLDESKLARSQIPTYPSRVNKELPFIGFVACNIGFLALSL